MDATEFNSQQLVAELYRIDKTETDDVFADNIVKFITTEATGDEDKDKFIAAQLTGKDDEIPETRIEALGMALGVDFDEPKPIYERREDWEQKPLGRHGPLLGLVYNTKVPGLTMVYEMPPLRTPEHGGFQNIGGMQEVYLRREKTS